MSVMRYPAAALLAAILAAPAAAADDKAADFKGKEIANGNFDGKDLEKATFEGATLKGASFKKANLAGANFRGATLTNVKFYHTDLGKADFRGATIEFSTFGDANMQDANLQGLDLSSVVLRDCDLRGADLRYLAGIGDVSGTLFNGADLRHADLRDLTNSPTTKPVFRRARYDGKTRWPADFAPRDVGALLEKDAEAPGPEITGTAARPGTDAKPVELPKPEKGDRQLDGLYWVKKSEAFGGAYYFSAQGYVCDSPTGGADPVDFPAAARRSPEGTGTYVVRKDELTLRFLKGKPDTKKFRADGDKLRLDEDDMIRVAAFPADSKLEGTYDGVKDPAGLQVNGSDSGANATAGAFRKYVFTRDGEFTLESAGAAGAGADPSGPGFFFAAVKRKGTYSLAGNTLTLKCSNGKTLTLTVFAFEDANKTPHLYIDGLNCKKIK